MQQRWPQRLWIVRHGESAGNVARDAAHAAGLGRIDIAQRDVDVPLSTRGEEQSAALARWFAELPEGERPDVVLTSPYQRARHTAEIIHAGGGLPVEPTDFVVDERLREKEFGILDRLTTLGIQQQHPDQAEFRRILGKFYFRPPAGESWCDVILRLRSALDTISLHHGGQRVLIVSHQVVVLCLRYLLEGLTEEQILAIDREGDVANCAVTEYGFDPDRGDSGRMRLHRYNFVAPLTQAGAPVTSEPDANVAAR
ncbi:histidine phosphatase family protein [Azospirillum rugosum]|uniref:Broad specificity phosphatase PhoE n=1 Tax=Azospirillum rugosum TaxID=416170 RepID=A0ABS4SSE6_9PROT|nr:histidine phosphatase family protein [Azospirillum rugosum]MBP2295485.1 broad specificity phosphatase PhoE [Azospirillum rugosum]MDQ0528364.1 broad specificity phosphatase PhoE [Azospirillum rugosum]